MTNINPKNPEVQAAMTDDTYEKRRLIISEAVSYTTHERDVVVERQVTHGQEYGEIDLRIHSLQASLSLQAKTFRDTTNAAAVIDDAQMFYLYLLDGTIPAADPEDTTT